MPEYSLSIQATWSQEYLTSLQKHNKWHRPTRNISVGDIVALHDVGLIPTKWPLGRVFKTFIGGNGLVRVVEVKTQSRTFTRPVHKVVLILPNEE